MQISSYPQVDKNKKRIDFVYPQERKNGLPDVFNKQSQIAGHISVIDVIN